MLYIFGNMDPINKNPLYVSINIPAPWDPSWIMEIRSIGRILLSRIYGIILPIDGFLTTHQVVLEELLYFYIFLCT